ncbi:MAG: ABC transporter ATP-binding protein [Sphingomonadaceae bacterium]
MPPVLTFEAVRFARGPRPILDSFDLAVDRGEHLLLLGPSGSGKTTLLHLAAGLLTPAAGTIRVNGTAWPADQAGRDRLRGRTVGIVFQTLRLVSALSLEGNLRLAADLAGQSADGLPRLLDELGLAHRAAARPRTLSQGEAQRAAIARALVARPALLLADEPTSALDDANAGRVADLLLASAAREGSTLVVATHDARLRPRFRHVIELEPAP